MHGIEFWFAVGSTYTWLAVSRVAPLVERGQISVSWLPYSTRVIMSELGTLPKNAPVKLDYMWRDIARRSARLGLDAALPAPYPLKAYDRANHVATLAAAEGWCLDYLLATYDLWMTDHLPPGEDANLVRALGRVGRDPDPTLARADAPETAAAFAANTDAARRLGIFGAPTFRVGDELFWGEDRLDDALDWAAHGRLMPR